MATKRKSETTAIYAGSFDPVTYGHIDIIKRALRLFDKIIVAIGVNAEKSPLFSREEQMRMIRESVRELNVEVIAFDGLLVDFAKKRGISHVIRGLRAVSDFEYEFQLATMNRNMWGDFDSVFLMTDKDFFYLSSSMVKQIAAAGGNVHPYVPSHVELMLRKKYAKK